ncbi:hypothetical protein GCM10027185_49890 [Spirosoma pulveris]
MSGLALLDNTLSLKRKIKKVPQKYKSKPLFIQNIEYVSMFFIRTSDKTRSKKTMEINIPYSLTIVKSIIEKSFLL